MADRVVLMHDGRIDQQGAPEQLYRSPNTEFAARFFGHVNELSGTATAPGLMRIDDGTLVPASGLNLAPGTPVRLLFRTERARVVPVGPADPSTATVQGTVESSDYMGMMVRYVVDLGGRQVIVTQAVGDRQYRVGEAVCVKIPADAWMTF